MGFAGGFVMVNVRVVVPARATSSGVKTLLMTGGAITLMDADAVFPVPPLVDVTALLVLT